MRISSELPLANPQMDLSTNEADKLRKSSRDFESLLLNSLWKEMQTEDEDDEDGGLSGMNGPLKELAFQSLSQQAAASGGLGLGRLILRSLGVSDSSTGTSPSEVQNHGGSADKVDIQGSHRIAEASFGYLRKNF